MYKTITLITFLALLFFSCKEVKTEYYPNGAIKSETYFKGGKENGPTYMYHKNTPQLMMSYNMQDGKKEGAFEKYYFDGKIEYRATYKNDLLEGKELMYDRDGGVVYEANYKNGKKEGAYITYHSKNMVKEQGSYKNDLWDGDWKYFDERGVLVGEASFSEGTGTLIAYNENGNIFHSTDYINNQKNGEEVSFSDSGDTVKVIVFKDDRIVSINGENVER